MMDKDKTAVTHPETIYSHLNDNELRSMYDESVWFGLNEGQRHDLLQETANREAMANGDKYSCEVVFANLDSQTAGIQSGNTIFINREMFVNDQISVEYDGKTITYNMIDSNFQAYETVLHEHQHVLQEAIVDGIVPTDAESKAIFEANGFNVSDVNGERGSQYLLGELNFSMYMLNPTEADAFKVSQEKTAALVEELTSQYGEKASNATYSERMLKESFEVKLEEYRELYNNPNIDKEVANVLLNSYQNTQIPVDKTIETIVHEEMILSQEALDNENKVMEDSKMEQSKWTDLHVSRETYDNTLRDSVNAFYEHSLNDPTVSQEQAVSDTSQMAEGYFNAMDAFDNAQSESASASISMETDSGVDVGSSFGMSEGVDGGCDGGIGVE